LDYQSDSKFAVAVKKIKQRAQSLLYNAVVKLENVESRFSANNSANIQSIIILAVFIFILMYFFNYLTPLASDDFNYHFIYWDHCTPDTRINGFKDIISSMAYHYYEINGRVLLHGILEVFTFIGKPFFNVVNSLMYVMLSLLIYKHCVGLRKSKHSLLLYLAINVMLWLFVQRWGQTTVWMTGSVNYLWGCVIRLIALLPFRLYADYEGAQKNHWSLAALMFFGGVIAGATNENTGAAMIGMMALFMISYRVHLKKVPVWSITGLVGAVAGYAFMVLAPSNFSRANVWNEIGNSFSQRVVNIPGNSILILAAPAALYVVLAYLLYTYRKGDQTYKLSTSFIYILGTFSGIYAMLATPFFPSRAWFGIVVLMIIAVGNLIFQIDLIPISLRRVSALVLLFCCVWCAMSFVKAAEDTIQVSRAYNDRVHYIEQEKALGNYDIVVERFDAIYAHSPLYEVVDLSPIPDNWSNQSKAAYYEVNSIVAK